MICDSPIVIGGTGGSGTRAVARYCMANGVCMGLTVNHAMDAEAFVPMLSSFINPILSETRSLDYSVDQLTNSIRQDVISALEEAVHIQLKGIGGHSRWGFKNPRQIFILPILAHLFPDLFFVHVIRDGRDITLSANQNQPRQHYSALFGEPWPQTPRSIGRFWGETNLAVARVGARLFGHRYIRVRIEDLCSSEPGERLRLTEALGFDAIGAVPSTSTFQAQPSFGRGVRHMTTRVEAYDWTFDAALQSFGYI